MSELEAAAMIEAMSVDDDGCDASFAGVACSSAAADSGANNMARAEVANEENISVQQPDRDPRDPGDPR